MYAVVAIGPPEAHATRMLSRRSDPNASATLGTSGQISGGSFVLDVVLFAALASLFGMRAAAYSTRAQKGPVHCRSWHSHLPDARRLSRILLARSSVGL